ncbi:MAG: hypothetical protein IKA87_08790 [Lentisphaeria bacterium]|nr:hypothetical protein [Lentisphaeria bacterium]
MKKFFTLVLLLVFAVVAEAGAAEKEKKWNLAVESNRRSTVYRIGETVRFIFKLTDEKNKPVSDAALKVELWFDGRYVLRKVKADKTGRIQVNIKPEKQCLVRCRAEYSSEVFAVGSATVSRAPNLGTFPNKKRR